MTTQANIYKRAVSKKLRFSTQYGQLNVEQLFDLSLNELDTLAVQYNESYEKSNKKSYLTEKSEQDTLIKLQFDIILDILNTKVAYKDRAAKAEETKRHNEKILSILQSKKEQDLQNLSTEELEALLKE